MVAATAALGSEWRTHWPLPFVSALGYAVAVTHIYSLGLFIEPLEAEFGWSRSDITLGLTINSFVVIMLGAFIGVLVDRWGPRRIALPGIAFYCAGLAALALAGPSTWSWRAHWMLLGMGAACVQPVVWTAAVAARFDRTRGMALAITMSGGGISTALTPILANYFISEFDWRGAYLALAGSLAMLALPLLLLFFDGERRDAAGPRERHSRDGMHWGIVRQSAGSARFISLSVIAFVMTAAMVTLVVHFVPILASSNMERTTAATAAGMIGISSIVGRLIGGFLLDRVSGPLIAAGVFTLPVIASALLLWAPMETGVAMVIAVLLGLALGGEVDVLAYMTSRYFDLSLFGTLFAAVSVSGAIGVGLGPVFGGLIHDRFGDYEPLMLSIMAASALSVLLSISLGSYPRRSS